MAQTLEDMLFDLSSLIATKAEKNPIKITHIGQSFTHANDCAAVALAIAFSMTVEEAHDLLVEKTDYDPRIGVTFTSLSGLMSRLGWTWTTKKVALRTANLSTLPKNAMICLTRHVVALVDGEIHDRFITYRAAGAKQMIGYWAPTRDLTAS